MKHTLREILAHFAKNAQHTHEAAAQATYDLGHAAGKAEAEEAHKAAEAAKPVPQRRSGDLDEKEDSTEAGEGEAHRETETAKGTQAQAGA